MRAALRSRAGGTFISIVRTISKECFLPVQKSWMDFHIVAMDGLSRTHLPLRPARLMDLAMFTSTIVVLWGVRWRTLVVMETTAPHCG